MNQEYNVIKLTLQVEDLTDDHGIFLIKLARKAIETYLQKKKKISIPPNTPPILKEKSGVFVTLNKIIDDHEELRGCIGYIEPIKPLVVATIDVAIAAALEDPRFPPVKLHEMRDITIEVTVLTPPKKIVVSSPNEYLSKIKIGRDGLLLRYKFFSGTLLPQVPVEYNWDVETFLEHLCLKAGLPITCWKDPEVEIYAYQGIIWKEENPYGKIVRVSFK